MASAFFVTRIRESARQAVVDLFDTQSSEISPTFRRGPRSVPLQLQEHTRAPKRITLESTCDHSMPEAFETVNPNSSPNVRLLPPPLKALAFNRFGGIEELQLQDVPNPQLAPSQGLVKCAGPRTESPGPFRPAGHSQPFHLLSLLDRFRRSQRQYRDYGCREFQSHLRGLRVLHRGSGQPLHPLWRSRPRLSCVEEFSLLGHAVPLPHDPKSVSQSAVPSPEKTK